MKHLKSHEFEIPHYFTRQDMQVILGGDGTTDRVRKLLADEADRCHALADELFEEADPDVANYADISRQGLSLELIAERLEDILDTLEVGELLRKDKLNTWLLPQNEYGSVAWETVIDTPKLERFRQHMHPLIASHRLREEKAIITDDIEQDDIPWNPDLLLYDADRTLPEARDTVRDFASYRVGELDDLDKLHFKESIQTLNDLYAHYQPVLDMHGSRLPEILDFLNQPALSKIYTPPPQAASRGVN